MVKYNSNRIGQRFVYIMSLMVVNFLWNAGDSATDTEVDSQNEDVSVVDTRGAFKDIRMWLSLQLVLSSRHDVSEDERKTAVVYSEVDSFVGLSLPSGINEGNIRGRHAVVTADYQTC